jgi:hypothetical protein
MVEEIKAFRKVNVAGATISPVQLELFRNEVNSHGIIAYLDTEQNDQETLFRLIARNSVKVVIDVRRLASFHKPRFQHKEVIDYFSERNIVHEDLYEKLEQIEGSSAIVLQHVDKMFGTGISKLLEAGPCIVIYSSAEELARVSRFRELIAPHARLTAIVSKHDRTTDRPS